MELRQVRLSLLSELYKVDLLGFDYEVQALRAILTCSDFAERWDILDCPKLISLAKTYRQLRGAQ